MCAIAAVGGIEEEGGIWGLQCSTVVVLSTEGCRSCHSLLKPWKRVDSVRLF